MTKLTNKQADQEMYHSPSKSDPATPDTVRARLHVLDWFQWKYPQAVDEFIEWEMEQNSSLRPVQFVQTPR